MTVKLQSKAQLSQELSIAETPSSVFSVMQWRANRLSAAEDTLAEEVPVALVYNGVSHAVMLASPQDLEDFALGFSLTEGILQNKSELYAVEIQPQSKGIELHLIIAAERFMQLKVRRRNLTGRTGCGLCGAESLQQVFQMPNITPLQQKNAMPITSILKANQHIKTLQKLQQATGATHACAWADACGNIQYLREDVGRHNAMDKLLGALIKQDQTGGFIITTSRASYEMVQKIAMAGFNLLAAISAPTGLAVRMADAYDITLIGFLREDQHAVYAHAERLTYDSFN